MSVEVSTWDELLETAVDTSLEILWTGGDLDFNDIAPAGFTSQVLLKGNIDFNNAEFKNMRLIYGSNNGALRFEMTKYLKNISFIDLQHLGAGTAIYIYGSSASIYNCKFHGELFPSGNCTFLTKTAVSNSKTILSSCGFNIRGTSSNYNIQLIGSSGGYASDVALYDCEIITDITQKGTTFTNNPMINCRIRGRYDNISETAVKIGDTMSALNVFYLEGNSVFNYPGSRISVYNNELATFSGTGAIGCTSEEIADTDYLYSKFFPAVTGGG